MPVMGIQELLKNFILTYFMQMKVVSHNTYTQATHNTFNNITTKIIFKISQCVYCLDYEEKLVQGCAQNDLSGRYLLTKLVQNCIKCSISALFMLRWWCITSLSGG